MNIENASNADAIRAMTDEELAEFLGRVSYQEEPWEPAFAKQFCSQCSSLECETDGAECPHGLSRLWWLRQPKEDL